MSQRQWERLPDIVWIERWKALIPKQAIWYRQRRTMSGQCSATAAIAGTSGAHSIVAPMKLKRA